MQLRRRTKCACFSNRVCVVDGFSGGMSSRSLPGEFENIVGKVQFSVKLLPEVGDKRWVDMTTGGCKSGAAFLVEVYCNQGDDLLPKHYDSCHFLFVVGVGVGVCWGYNKKRESGCLQYC